MKNDIKKGIYFAIFAAIISGVSIFINKFAVGVISPPLLFTAVKNASVGLAIVTAILALGKWREIFKLKKSDAIYLVLVAVIGGSLPFYLFFTGLSQIPAINGAIIQKTLVLWVAVLALPLLKEKLSKRQLLAVMLLFTGNLLIGGFNGFKFSQGELYVLLATILWGVETVIAKKVLFSVSPDLVTGARMGLGSIILLIATATTSPSSFSTGLNLSPIQWFWLLLTMTTLLAYVVTWYRALKLAPATTVTAVLVASTLVTNLLSAVFITHTWSVLMVVQAVFMILGIALFLSVGKNSKPSSSKEITFFPPL